MKTLAETIKAVKSTKRYIRAWAKRGTEDLIIEAEKCYVYEQYDLAFEICALIVDKESCNDYSSEVYGRANELRALIVYHHASELRDNYLNDNKKNACELLRQLDSRGWDIYDSRYILGKFYAETGEYQKAMTSFAMWATERDFESGHKALVEMYKRGQFDTDKQHENLFMAYYKYFYNKDIASLLLRSAKYAEEYFPQYTHEFIAQKFGLRIKQVSQIHYTDDDFVLPYNIRCFDCANSIREYVRSVDRPTLDGCMRFLARPDNQSKISVRTNNAIQAELRDALLRNYVDNEKTKIELMQKHSREILERYDCLQKEIERHNSSVESFQARSLRNQQEALWEQKWMSWEISSLKHRL